MVYMGNMFAKQRTLTLHFDHLWKDKNDIQGNQYMVSILKIDCIPTIIITITNRRLQIMMAFCSHL